MSARNANCDRSSSRLAYSAEERHPLVEAFLDQRVRRHGTPDPCLEIAAGDEMFAYALTEQHQHRGLALVSYLRSGLTAWETVAEILSWHFGAIDRMPGMLDFASGYGRMTRFLVGTVPAERATVAEISEPALEFQSEQLGVETLRSANDPSQLDLDRDFSAVTALSLFTHLPEKPFSDWLARLWEAVAPGGLLVFSVNGEEVLFGDSKMPKGGLLFQSLNEISSLDPKSYGSTWVTDEFVRRSVSAACPDAAACQRLERGLWHFQDLYLVARSEAASSVGLARDRGELEVGLPPEGYLDTCILLDQSKLQVAGWAIDRQRPGKSVEIRVSINGVEVASVLADQERDDLVAPLGVEHRRCGWIARVESEQPFRPHDIILIEARSASGRVTVLHLSQIEGADLGRRVAGALEETHAQNRELRAEKAELARQIAEMERSRFWKARNLWFRAQKALGIRRGMRDRSES